MVHPKFLSMFSVLWSFVTTRDSGLRLVFTNRERKGRECSSCMVTSGRRKVDREEGGFVWVLTFFARKNLENGCTCMWDDCGKLLNEIWLVGAVMWQQKTHAHLVREFELVPCNKSLFSLQINSHILLHMFWLAYMKFKFQMNFNYCLLQLITVNWELYIENTPLQKTQELQS